MSSPMLITFSEGNKRFEAHNAFDQRESLKSSGWHWEQDKRIWWTVEHQQTEPFLYAATAEALSEYHKQRALEYSSLVQSRAMDANIEVPCLPGLKYMPFQKAGIQFGIFKKKVLIADEMGLGKTIMAIGWLNWLMVAEGIVDPNVLVICPAKGVYQWEYELRKWLVTQLPIAVTKPSLFVSSGIRIINYDKLWFFEQEIRAIQWDLLIVDECHYLMNPRAERTVFVYGYQSESIEPIPCERAAFMTGTPIRNRPRELFPLLHYLDPQRWDSFAAYARRYCGGGETRTRKGGVRIRSDGASNLAELQSKLRSTIMIRRLKKDVLPELPVKSREIIELPSVGDIRTAVLEEVEAFRSHEKKLASLRHAVEAAKDGSSQSKYKKAVQQLRKQVSVSFREMSAFRKRTAVLKCPYVIQHLENLLATGIKVVCFGHHHEVLDKIQDYFSDLSIGSVMITGETSPAKAKERVDLFQSNPDCKLFIGGIISAGVLWTLTASHHVVFAELDWVPGNLSQAEDRVHRIGQYHSVLIQHLVLENSLDATIVRKIVAKQDIIDEALNTQADSQFTSSASVPEAEVRNIPPPVKGTTTFFRQGTATCQRAASSSPVPPSGLHSTIPGPGIQPGPCQGPVSGVPLPRPSTSNGGSPDPRLPSQNPSHPSGLVDGPAAILQCLRMLAGVCDGAHRRDVQGFNSLDYTFGKVLAVKSSLTDRMAYVGQKLIVKYKRQLPPDLYASAVAWQAPDFAKQKKQ